MPLAGLGISAAARPSRRPRPAKHTEIADAPQCSTRHASGSPRARAPARSSLPGPSASQVWILCSAGQHHAVAIAAATIQQPRPIQGQICEAAVRSPAHSTIPPSTGVSSRHRLRPVGARTEIPQQAGLVARVGRRPGTGGVGAGDPDRAEADNGTQRHAAPPAGRSLARSCRASDVDDPLVAVA